MNDPELPEDEPYLQSGGNSTLKGCFYAVLVLAGLGLLFFGTCLFMVSNGQIR